MNDNEFKLHAELEDTHWWFRVRREIIIDCFLRTLTPDSQKRIVEIGCGTGGNLKELSRYYSVMGVDLSPEAVKYAVRRVNAPIELGDFRDVLRYDRQWIDGVLLADVLEHVKDDKNFLEDIISALKPGAIVVITVPAFRFLWSRHDVALGHLRRYRQDDFCLLWEGLPVKKHFCSYFNCLLFPLIAAARLLVQNNASQNLNESNLKPVNRFLNTMLSGVFGMEKHALRWMRLPFGVSLIAVLEKTGTFNAT